MSTAFARQALEAGAWGLVGGSHLSPYAAAGLWGAAVPGALARTSLAQCHPPVCPHRDILTLGTPAWLPQNIWACDSWAEPG